MNRTTIDIYLEDKRHIDNIKWYVRVKFGKNKRYIDIMKWIISFIKEHEDEFLNYIHKKLSKSERDSSSN